MHDIILRCGWRSLSPRRRIGDMHKPRYPARLPWSLRGVACALAAIASGLALADGAPSTVNSAATSAPAKPVPLPAGQVWECMVNGQRTFSDVRCGAQSSIRQLSPVNVMDVAASRPPARYGMYPTTYAPVSNPPMPYPSMAADDNAPDVANDTYWGPGVIVVNPRSLRGHRAPHSNHGHGRPAKN